MSKPPSRRAIERFVWRLGIVYAAGGSIYAAGGLQLQVHLLGWATLPRWLLFLPLWLVGSVAAGGLCWAVFQAWREGALGGEHDDPRYVLPYVTPPLLFLGLYILFESGRWEGLESFAVGSAFAFCGWKAMTARLPEDPAAVKPWL